MNGQVVAEIRTVSDTSEVQHWFNFRGIDGKVVHQFRTAADGTNKTLFTPLTDHNGSVIALLMADWVVLGEDWGSSQLAQRFLYDSMGESTELDYYKLGTTTIAFTGTWDMLHQGRLATGTARSINHYGDLLYHTAQGVYDPSLGKVLTSADLDPWNGFWTESGQWVKDHGTQIAIGVTALAASILTAGVAAPLIMSAFGVSSVAALATASLAVKVGVGMGIGAMGGAAYSLADTGLTQYSNGRIDLDKLGMDTLKGAMYGAVFGGVFAAAGHGIQRGVKAIQKLRAGGASSTVVGPNGPYLTRIHPKVSGRPAPRFSVDTRGFTSGKPTANGGIRNSKRFWKQWANKNPNSLSGKNLNFANKGRAPTIDEQWVRAFPEHADYIGKGLVHHHIEQGAYAIPVPAPTHLGSGGVWHGKF